MPLILSRTFVHPLFLAGLVPTSVEGVLVAWQPFRRPRLSVVLPRYLSLARGVGFGSRR